MSATDSRNIRRSVIAGTWYPGDAQELRGVLDGFLNQVPPQLLEGRLVGLISPHAGYIYSGQVAAFAYGQLRGKAFPKVVVVSPVHRMYTGEFATTDKAYYETPLGLVPIDKECVAAVERQVRLNHVSQDMEHSLEIQLPFLQHVLGSFALTPVMMGDQEWGSAVRLGQALASAIGEQSALLVASTDLSHYHPYEVAVRLDQAVIKSIIAYDLEGLSRSLASGKAEACGGGPVTAVMLAAQALGANRAVLLKYMNSGDVTGDRSGVVGYAAVALLA